MKTKLFLLLAGFLRNLGWLEGAREVLLALEDPPDDLRKSLRYSSIAHDILSDTMIDRSVRPTNLERCLKTALHAWRFIDMLETYAADRRDYHHVAIFLAGQYCAAEDLERLLVKRIVTPEEILDHNEHAHLWWYERFAVKDRERMSWYLRYYDGDAVVREIAVALTSSSLKGTVVPWLVARLPRELRNSVTILRAFIEARMLPTPSLQTELELAFAAGLADRHVGQWLEGRLERREVACFLTIAGRALSDAALRSVKEHGRTPLALAVLEALPDWQRFRAHREALGAVAERTAEAVSLFPVAEEGVA